MKQNTAIGVVQLYAVTPAVLPTKIRDGLLDIVTATVQENTATIDEQIAYTLSALEDLSRVKHIREFDTLTAALIDLMI